MRFVILFAFLISGFASRSQTMKIIYKKRGNTGHPAILTFTDNAGHKTLQPADFDKSEDLYFTITPDILAKRNYFKENDIPEYFNGISIEQDGQELKQNNNPDKLIGNSGKITSVIISFPKSGLKLYQSFTFITTVDTSLPFTINEIYYPSYKKYKDVVTEAQDLMNSKKYLAALNKLNQVETQSKKNPEIMVFSFYNKATIELPKQAIESLTDSLYKKFSVQHDLFLKKKSKRLLDSCNVILQTFLQAEAIFQPFLQTKQDGIPKLKAHVLQARKTMVSKYNAGKQTLKQSAMALLETGDYSNYKFLLFVNVLNRMLCHIDSLKIINGITPLNINFLNSLPEKTTELVSTGWFNDFKNLIELLNDNIKYQKFIFNPDVLSHLKLIDSQEPQPYFEIFSAFNSLENNPRNFYTSMDRAIVKCTDSTLLSNMNLWQVSYKITHEQINSRYVSEINKGIRQINNNQWADAENTFNITKRQTNTIAAPWFYSAVIKYHKNEPFSAKAQLDKAQKLYPHYLAPRQFIFKQLLAENNYPNLLVKADSAISSFNIWYFHYIKAFSLFKLNRSHDCIKELLTQCIPMNRWNLDEYFLLGDAYLHLRNYEKAKEAYMKTREIDPYANSKFYNDKMDGLFKQQRAYPPKTQGATVTKPESN